MPIFSPVGNLDITNATLRTSNIETQHIQISNVAISAAHDLQQVTGIGNATTITTEFNNATTSLTTASNVTVGNELTVSGNIISSQETTLSGNVTVGKNLFLSSNTTTSVDSNVVAEHFGPHKRYPITPVLKKFPDVDFTQDKFDYNDSTLTYTQAGYVVTASSQSSGSEVWRLFDDGDWNQEAIDKYTTTSFFQYNPSSNPYSLGDVSGEWFKVKFPRKVIINKFTLNVGDNIGNGLAAFKVLGSDDDTNWTEVRVVSGLTSASYTTAAPFVTTVESVSSEAYRYYAVVITQLLGVARVTIREVEFYGYEEDLPAGDTSLDTTFTSILNRPQTSGVKVYVDGDTLDNKVTGPTPTGTDATYDSTGKYWTLAGALTSNVTVEANTFLEGDAPHSVSVWFSSSNLEANVSNTCVFSVSDQEHLNSQNLDLQSNTWHNLTYAYQGEGGSKVTYLDGRKVAEDQAEDTFGEYPPFAMTGYSQGGYVVSASDEDTAYPLWRIFADDSDFYVSSTSAFPGGVYTSGSTYNLGTNSGGSGTDNGHWIKLAVPYKLKITHVNIDARTGYESQAPKNFKFYGSNDDTNWEQIGPSFSNEAPQDDGTSYYTLNSTKAYKYIGLVVTETVGNGNGRLGLQQLKFYGHRENDLVRLPDPTRVLKYPHVALSGPAQRGYVVTQSSYATYNANHYGYGWKAFDSTRSSTSAEFSWQTDSSGSGTYPSSGNARTGVAMETITENSNTHVGSWVTLETPHKIQVSSVELTCPVSVDQYRPNSVVILGSDNNSTWNFLTGDISSTYTNDIRTITISSTVAYKYHMLLVKTIGSVGAGYATTAFLSDIRYYGTEEATSVPIQIGGGNIDRVANFRVYDKFVGEDQALEIWDAQKDEFGRAKSSMTLHKGYLGIGTEEPEGRLAILDEPHNLEEFPPRAMTDYKTYFEGHGEFCVYSSSAWGGSYHGWKAFTKGVMNPLYTTWISENGSYSTTTGLNVLSRSFQGNLGEYLTIELPYKIQLKRFTIQRRLTLNQTFETAVFYGSEDGITWSKLKDIIMPPYDTGYNEYPFIINDLTHYKHFGIVVTKIKVGQVTYCNIGELRLFGTREQGQSVLHDGQLTLTKNLDVPRIGPPLDADDTPRRDRLVVEYNTSSNPTFEGAVRDTSGRGNDGVFYGGASYDATEKALVFDGGDQRITTNMNNKGDTDVSISFWIKRTADTDPAQTVVMLGTLGTGGTSIAIDIYDDGEYLYWWTQSGDNIVDDDGALQFPVGTWVHVTATRTGRAAGYKLYINGVDWTPNMTQTTGTKALTLPDNAQVTIGSRDDGTTFNTEGRISNFKLYDTALTAEEVKTLYDMGRLGNAIKTPLQIEAPVDIRGDIRYITNIRPLPKQTMWDHESNGHFTRGIYPITGTQGGSKVYNMLCEPDWCGGGWMCAAQLPNGKDVVTTPVNLFTAEYGDPSNLTWSNDFAVPMNIFSNDSGYDLDVMLVLLGGTQAGRAGAGGARNGGIYRGVNLTQALNTGWPTNSVYPANISTSGLASSADGYNFVSRTPSGYNFQPYKANSAWRLSFSSLAAHDMAYNDSDINTMGWLIHTSGNVIHYTYSYVHGGGGAQNQSGGNTSWAAVRFFVRPKRY